MRKRTGQYKLAKEGYSASVISSWSLPNSAGLGSCPISEIRNHAAAISALLELPDRVFPIAGLTLGYPATKEPMSPRLAQSG